MPTRAGPNQGRVFFKCAAISAGSQCRFFCWADEAPRGGGAGTFGNAPRPEGGGGGGAGAAGSSCFNCGESEFSLLEIPFSP